MNTTLTIVQMTISHLDEIEAARQRADVLDRCADLLEKETTIPPPIGLIGLLDQCRATAGFIRQAEKHQLELTNFSKAICNRL